MLLEGWNSEPEPRACPFPSMKTPEISLKIPKSPFFSPAAPICPQQWEEQLWWEVLGAVGRAPESVIPLGFVPGPWAPLSRGIGANLLLSLAPQIGFFGLILAHLLLKSSQQQQQLQLDFWAAGIFRARRVFCESLATITERFVTLCLPSVLNWVDPQSPLCGRRGIFAAVPLFQALFPALCDSVLVFCSPYVSAQSRKTGGRIY